MKSITIDRSKPLAEDAATGHNRWHPDIEPLVEVDPGEECVLETRDASDGQVTRESGGTRASGRIHPLTGPVYVKGAQPGDLLEVEYLEIEPQPYGWTTCGPGMGFLPDLLSEHFVAHWDIKDGWATSAQMPGVRIPDGCFMGTAGVAPSAELLAEWTRREADLASRGGRAMPPMAEDAVPTSSTSPARARARGRRARTAATSTRSS